jgi:hypothetical protein
MKTDPNSVLIFGYRVEFMISISAKAGELLLAFIESQGLALD